ncbi:hypothetical protein QA596_12145 [Balneolales bacterium ANBcel1]|nr:hypothetical protein [Balneolales bacterium ANBcel1]
MGQQQLLLVILVTIIVGTATVVGLNVFGTAATDANRDAVRQDLLAAASVAQTVYVRPQMMDGAGGDFTRVEDDLLRRLRLPARENADGTFSNENGTYEIEGDVTSDAVTIRGTPSSGGPAILVTIARDTDTRQWDVSVSDAAN